MDAIDPKLREWATPTQLKYLDAIEQHGSGSKAADALGVHKSAVNRSIQALKNTAAKHGYSPEHDLQHPVAPGQMLRGASTLYKDGKAILQWVKTKADDEKLEAILREFIGNLVEDARGLSPVIPAPRTSEADLLAVYPMGDPHFGMQSWGDETGDDFDLKIAEQLLYAAIDRLVESAPAAATALLLNLGDFFHADNQNNTSQSGHQLDVDTRWAKVMQVGLRAMVHAIKRLLEKHQAVIVRNVKGNHDSHSSFALALALDAYFSNNPRVKVELSPAAFWYFRFGQVLIGSTHGDTCKMADLPAVMACDRSKEWGETSFRYWYVGHIHHDELKEFPGVTVESFRTLAARDAWHAAKGYRAGRDMRCIVLHKEFGEIGRHRCDLAMIRGKAA
jgi:hypothetical protein